MKYFKLVLLIWTFFISFAQADIEVVKQAFKSDYFQFYERGKCGKNIMNFIRRHESKVNDWSDSYIVQVINNGFSSFGMVNVELARGKGAYNRDTGIFGVGEANFYHHAFLDYQGEIIDFDFTNNPVVVSKEEYIERMFLKDAGEFRIPRQTKLDDYQVELIAVEDFLRKKDRSKKIKLKDYLR